MMATVKAKTMRKETETAVNLPQLAANALILTAWLWLYWPLADYLQVIFTREDFRTNQILLIAVIALIVAQWRRSALLPRFDAPPRLASWPLALSLGGSLAYLLSERFLSVNTLSATLFGLASYGLLGLWLEPARWRGGLLAALLLIGALPFGEHMQTFIGYPMRIVTAALVRDGLTAVGVGSIGIDTILVFENGVSQVDIPCSGVKSLWTGAMFLIAATWIERRPLTWRWWGTAVIFALTLFLVNLVRVAILVTVGEALGWRLVAEMLHVPLGVLGFVAACALALWLLRRQPAPAPQSPARSDHSAPSAWLTPALLLVILLMAALYTPRPISGLSQPAADWEFPTALAVTPLPLKPDEYEWLTRDGADTASRYRFTWEGVSGSMILITSHTWRAHHRPERCFEVYGLTLEESHTHLVNGDQAAMNNGVGVMPVRFISLGRGDEHAALSATYWFQSAARITDDYGTRIWADLSPQREEWVLVSILFDDVYQADNPDLNSLYLALHAAAAANIGNR